MAITEEALARDLAMIDPNICRDKAVELLLAGKAAEAAKWFGLAITARPGDASLYWARSRAWERAGKVGKAVTDAGVGVCLRPRIAAGFARLSAAYEAQGRHAQAVRVCFLGMRCGDSSKNGELGQRMSRAREAGKLAPLEWKPIERRERWLWVLLSFRGFLLRVVTKVAGRLHLSGDGIILKICGGRDSIGQSPWPPGALQPELIAPHY